MIAFFNAFTNQYALVMNFIAHVIIFIGTFYVALHNRRLPQWHITPLWYAGVCSFAIATSICVQWAIGPEHPLSYWNSGIMGETVSNMVFAAIALIMLVGTVLRDLAGKRKRKQEE